MKPPDALKRKETRICKRCGAEYQPVKSWQLFCQGKCRMKFWADNHKTVPLSKLQKLIDEAKG